MIFYGETGTGKSTIIIDLLWNLSSKIPSCFVISPTESQNGTYHEIIPKMMIDARTDLTCERLR